MRIKTDVITHFAKLFALKNKPENLSYSVNTFAFLFVLLIISLKFTIKNSIPQLENISTLIPVFIVAHEVLFLLILHFMLTKLNKKNRFVQAACNFLGVNIFNCVLAGLLANLPSNILLLCLSKAWIMIINFHITKHAFNTKLLQAIAIYTLINFSALLLVTIPFSLLTATKLAN